MKSLTKGHLGEEVVDHMVMGNVMQEKSTHPPEEVSVDSGSGPPREAPFAIAIVREFGIRVVKVSYHNKPMRHHEPRNSVKLEDFG